MRGSQISQSGVVLDRAAGCPHPLLILGHARSSGTNVGATRHHRRNGGAFLMMKLTAADVVQGCADDSEAAGITIRAELQPLGGPGAPVAPAIHSGRAYQQDKRWWSHDGVRESVDAVVIDGVASQANRLELALKQHREVMGLPEIVLDLSGLGVLPAHLPTVLTSFDFPHRQADAYLRDAVLDGQPFLESEPGMGLMNASATAPQDLFRWVPQALLFGFWQSHLGKHQPQTKLARSWVSEIVGYDPATLQAQHMGLKGDALNLSIAEKVVFDEEAVAGWTVDEGGKKSGGKKERLSEIGHGQVPIGGSGASESAGPLPVSFAAIEQTATVSFAGLRRIETGDPEANAWGRALLVAVGLAAHVYAFGRPFSLRSGCDLRAVNTSWSWLGAGGDEQIAPLDGQQVLELFQQCVAGAEQAGLPVGTAWPDPLLVAPGKSLSEVIRKTWPEA